jgi:hypothetical protein
MKKQVDRVKSWRERRKAEGKTSITVLLSQEARVILTEEKKKTGESYAVIVEKALQNLKKQGYGLSTLKHFSKREGVVTKIPTGDNQPSVTPVTSHESGGGQPKMLIDDLANYPSLEDIEREQAEKKQNSTYNLKFKEGLITRLFRSRALFGHRKKWFK